jgi:hypothetical protein
VDVVIVQAGDDGAVVGVEHGLSLGGGEVPGHVDDPVLGADVDDRAVE